VLTLGALLSFAAAVIALWLVRERQAAADINHAIEDVPSGVSEEAGLPLHRFNLEDASAAHAAVESGAVGKVLVTVASG
jgi:NADPH2:quinone reductase